MKCKSLLIVAAIFLSASALYADEKDILFEIRAPKTVEFSHATFFFVGERTSQTGPLNAAALRQEGTTNIFEKTVILSTLYKEHRYAVMIMPKGGRKGVSQIFRLPLHQNAQPSEWSQWQRPNYVENSNDAMSNFMDNQESPDRSTNIPSDCFEVRYKVEVVK